MLLAVFHHNVHNVVEWCPRCCLFFPRPCRKSLPVPGERPFPFPHAEKAFRSLAWEFLNFPMSEKFSGPLRKTFSIPPCWKSLPVPGLRIFTFPPCQTSVFIDIFWKSATSEVGVGGGGCTSVQVIKKIRENRKVRAFQILRARIFLKTSAKLERG